MNSLAFSRTQEEPLVSQWPGLELVPPRSVHKNRCVVRRLGRERLTC